MQTLRRAHFIARIVLAWFVLSLGVAVAAPLVQPQDLLLVCSATGTAKVLVKAADGSTQELGSASMDCPLCMPSGAPPLRATAVVVPAQLLAYALQSIPAAHITVRTAAPLPARGPPL